MNVYVIGNNRQVEQVRLKISDEYLVMPVEIFTDIETVSESAVFDFSFDDSPDNLDLYSELTNIHLFINATRGSLAELTYFAEGGLPNLYGIAGDPTFLERPLLEVSVHHNNRADARKLFSQLGIEATLVDDRVGLGSLHCPARFVQCGCFRDVVTQSTRCIYTD